MNEAENNSTETPPSDRRDDELQSSEPASDSSAANEAAADSHEEKLISPVPDTLKESAAPASKALAPSGKKSHWASLAAELGLEVPEPEPDLDVSSLDEVTDVSAHQDTRSEPPLPSADPFQPPKRVIEFDKGDEPPSIFDELPPMDGSDKDSTDEDFLSDEGDTGTSAEDELPPGRKRRRRRGRRRRRRDDSEAETVGGDAAESDDVSRAELDEDADEAEAIREERVDEESARDEERRPRRRRRRRSGRKDQDRAAPESGKSSRADTEPTADAAIDESPD